MNFEVPVNTPSTLRCNTLLTLVARWISVKRTVTLQSAVAAHMVKSLRMSQHSSHTHHRGWAISLLCMRPCSECRARRRSSNMASAEAPASWSMQASCGAKPKASGSTCWKVHLLTANMTCKKTLGNYTFQTRQHSSQHSYMFGHSACDGGVGGNTDGKSGCRRGAGSRCMRPRSVFEG